MLIHGVANGGLSYKTAQIADAMHVKAAFSAGSGIGRCRNELFSLTFS